jgi:hypothetical protein
MMWDARKMASNFLMKANAIRLEDSKSLQEKSELMAMQEIFYECYMNSFDEKKVVEFLRSASVDGKIELPEDVDEQAYTNSFRRAATRVLKDLGA